MKTSSAAHRLVRIRVVVIGFVLAAICGLEFQISQSLAARFGQAAAACQAETAQVPSVSLGDLMAAAR